VACPRRKVKISASVAGAPPALGFRSASVFRDATHPKDSLRAGAAWRRKPQDAASVLGLSRRQASGLWLSRSARAPLGAGSRQTRLQSEAT
jgi:hypothetical protein